MASPIDEYKRVTIRSVKDKSSGAYAIADYDKDIRAIERALMSALPKDAFYHMKPKDINYDGSVGVAKNQIGKLREDFYIKEEYAKVAQLAIAQAVAKMKFSGSAQSKYQSTKLRPLSDEEAKLVKELETLNKQKQDGKETETTRFNRGAMLKILGVLTIIANLTRRILSSVLSVASRSVQDTITAHNLGTSYEAIRQYRHVETMHGMKEGTFTGALSDIQSKFGNITTLDESSLEALAVVMGGKIEEMATMGLGSSNPEKILESILDTFNEKANSGVNSIGQYVGEQQARRELYGYLLKISPQIADIFATMQEEQHNINSLFRNQSDTFAQWKNIKPDARGNGADPARTNVLVELGEEWNILKEVMEQVRDAIAVSLAPALLKLLRRIADSRVGMTQSEKEARNRENKKANEEFITSAQATMALMKGDWDNLSDAQKARYYALSDAVREAQQANKGSGVFNKSISYAVPTQEELQVATQSLLYEQASGRAWLSKHESAYRELEDITDEEIQVTAESNAYDIAKARAKYDKAKADAVKKANEPYEGDKAVYEQELAEYNRNLELEKARIFNEKKAEANLSKQERISRAKVEATKAMVADKGDSGFATMNATDRAWEHTLRTLEVLYGIDLRHDEFGNELTLKEAIAKARKQKLIAKQMKGIDLQPNYNNLPKQKQDTERWKQEAEAEALAIWGEAPVFEGTSVSDVDFPTFWMWMYKQDPWFFNDKVLNKRADEMSAESKYDPYYDWTLLHQDYGADFEKFSEKLPVGYTNRNAGIFSYDETSDNGVITHKIVLDLNNNGKLEVSDKLLESFITNRAGFVGTLTDKVEIKDGKVTAYARPASSYKPSAKPSGASTK
jgi:hypothetical protein